MKYLICFWICLVSPSLAQTLELHFIDVGQGDAVFIRAPSGQGVLYDGGRRQDGVLTYLKSIGVSQVELVVASHPDADHIGGLAAIIDAYNPTYFMDNGLTHTTQTYFNLLTTLERNRTQVLAPSARTITLGEVTLQILPPPGQTGLGNNDNSVGLIVTYGSFSAALTGDAEAAEFNWWAENVPELLRPVDVYKASHHGSENGDTPLSMSRFKPEVVVVSAGLDNGYGHPSARALRLYDAIDATVYRTDLQGNVMVQARTDGSYDVRAERGTHLSAPASTPVPLPNTSLQITCVERQGREHSVLLETDTALNTSGWFLTDELGRRVAVPLAALDSGTQLSVRTPPMFLDGSKQISLHHPSGEVIDSFDYGSQTGQVCRGSLSVKDILMFYPKPPKP